MIVIDLLNLFVSVCNVCEDAIQNANYEGNDDDDDDDNDDTTIEELFVHLMCQIFFISNV